MEIKYLGHSSFLIKSKDTVLITDPFDPLRVGLRFPKIEADIVTVSHQHFDHNAVALVGGKPLVIDLSGEFEKKGMRIFGYSSFHDKKQGEERGSNILYKIESEDISILHCGDLGYLPDDKYLEQIGGVYILLIPVGGFVTINSSEAVDLIKKIEPSIVIPMHYALPPSKTATMPELLTLSDFLKKIGSENIEPIPKLIIRKDNLKEEMKVVVLSKIQ
jgi:L-ascorbate metabolism protein UlaG (beta-lactamase superfamily)